MRDVPILKLAGVMIVLTVITSVIMLIPDWFGEQASTAADDIDRLFDISIVFSSFVFSVVMVLLGYAIWRWRAKPGDESDGEPIHGNTRLEIAWTAIPTVIVSFLAAISWIVLDDIEANEPAEDSMALTVTAQQFAWEFEYPEAGKTSREFHVPVDRQLDVELRALDVLHSFWVPEWRIKRDLVPGAPGASIDDDFVVEPNKEGTYSLVCTELCGLGHSTMRVEVVVESQAEFDAWLVDQPETPAENEDQAAAEDAS
ncbi:MAG: cytochrome c oxidase subunit II [Solirubrobacterales bacterium]|nr:cytochrome c oxidase subunit II [Solirubrobacterales bacterium]